MRKYIIVPYSKMTESNVGKFGYSSMSAMRKNVEGFGERKVVLDYGGLFAPWGFGSYTTYTHSEIRVIMKTDEWTHSYPESY